MASTHETEFESKCRASLLARLKRMMRLIELGAPEVIVDHAFDLVFRSHIAFCGDYALRRLVDRMRRRFAVEIGHCEICFGPRERPRETACDKCVAECENLAVDAM